MKMLGIIDFAKRNWMHIDFEIALIKNVVIIQSNLNKYIIITILKLYLFQQVSHLGVSKTSGTQEI